MAALNTDISLEQGSTFVLEFQVFTDDLVPLNLLTPTENEFGTLVYGFDDFRARMRIKKSKYRTPILYTAGITANYITQPGSTLGFVQDGIFFVGGSTGSIRIVVSAETTAAFKSGRYFYDLELVKTIGATGEMVTKLLAGKVEIDAESTT